MRVVFMGTPEFALPSLRALTKSSYEVCAVFTQPDRPAGRGQKPQPPVVKAFAQAAGLPIYQPTKIRSEENRPLLESLKPDFLAVVAFGQILPGWLLELPKIAPVNVHASLLPRYRGAAPIPWAILNGDGHTGVTTMLMEETLDTGPILLQQEVPISIEMTGGELHDLLSEVGADLLLKTLDGLSQQSLQPVPQDHHQATIASKITKEMAAVSWEYPALKIHNQIRALNPAPVAYSYFRGERLQIFRSLPAESTSLPPEMTVPGTLIDVTQDGLLVTCGEETILEILEVQLADRKRVSGRDFANGARLRPGDALFSGKKGA